jgi:hypothetical protein
MKPLLWILSVAALSGCAISAVMVFTGALDEATFKSTFLVCSVLWFVISSARIYLPAKR